ncbi:MAG: YqgE/AlgH family protein [Pirellulales bacterium]|nr:YqgE/AlgH family protein [Pirellulales bacterium]
MTKSLQGHLLVASPQERDPDFVKAVILLIQHSADQAVGVVLNRPTATTIEQLWSSAMKKRCPCRQPVNAGGPVPGPLMAVHTCQPLAEIEILPSLYYAVQKKNLDKLVRQTDHRFKVFDSHAGWGPGQLEAQIEAGAWLTVPATIEHVFGRVKDLWDDLAPAA